MADIPPPQFVAYPRTDFGSHGTTDRLQALADGYFGLTKVFYVNILLAVTTNVIFRGAGLLTLVGIAAVIIIVIGGMSYPYNTKIAFGKEKGPSYAVVASLLTGLNSALCCGIVGIIVMQQIAFNEMKRYGVQAGFLGLKKSNLQTFISARRASESGVVPPSVG